MTDNVYREALELHEKHGGKMAVSSKVSVRSRKDLSLAYTPGVAEVCRQIAKDKKLAYKYTIKKNTVAIVTDGTAVLGLGNIGPSAAIPVMEGKAILFKEFAGIDAFPLCLESDNVVGIVESLAPIFGGINLEDIKAPQCFDIEEQLKKRLDIPVFHDDQHGTAIVVFAALINAAKVTGKKLDTLNVVVNGAGAAGMAITKLIKEYVNDVIICDSKGVIHQGRGDLSTNKYKQSIAKKTNKKKITGSLSDAVHEADVIIGVSVANAFTQDMIHSMSDSPIVFALANPDPEILPDLAKKAGAAVIGTGRSDFPNQINNVLAFPGVFRGALDARATDITEEMKVAAAHALADYVKKPTAEAVIPDVLDKNVAPAVAEAVKRAWKK